MPRSRVRTPALAAGVIAVGTVLAACGPADDRTADHAPSPSVTVSPAPDDEASSGAPRDDVVTRVVAGAVEIEVRAPDGAVTTEDSPGSATVSVDVARLAPGRGASVDLVSGGVFLPRPDGSVTVRTSSDGTADAGDDAGDDALVGAAGGLTPPTGAAAFHQREPRTVELVADDGAAGTVTVVLGARGVESTDWGDREGGRSLAVEPTDWARQARTAGVDVIWSELVADDPEVESAGMHDQLVCHSIGAPDKATWNLEPWRPDVGLLQVLADRCNPV